jgi:RimJ/RimL family protein N-acetyltransferase
MNFTIELETSEVKLRPIQNEDFQHFHELTNDESMWIYFTSDLSVPEILREWVNEAVAQTLAKTRLAFTILDKKNNRVIGSTSFGNISFHDKRIEIGWTWIGRDFQGKGFNGQIKYLMIKYCFEELEFERVELKTDVLNLPARKAMIRLGLKEEGILRSHTLMTHNRRRDTIYYSVLKSEWAELKAKNNWL